MLPLQGPVVNVAEGGALGRLDLLSPVFEDLLPLLGRPLLILLFLLVLLHVVGGLGDPTQEDGMGVAVELPQHREVLYIGVLVLRDHGAELFYFLLDPFIIELPDRL